MSVGGVIPAVVTPFAPGGGAVELDALDAHVAWLHARGIRCIAPLGTNGEGPSLSLRERQAVIERLAAHRTGIALLPGTGATSLPETIELSRFAAERGAALLVAPPSYYDFDERGVSAYFRALFEALPSDARVFLYQIPRHTGVPITDSLLHALGEHYGPMLAGVKDSGGDFEHTRAWLSDFPQLTILSGSDATAAAAYEAGGRGLITMLANIFPEEHEQIRAGTGVAERQAFLTAVRELVQEVPRHAALKQLLQLVAGLPRSAVRPPLAELDSAQTTYLETRFEQLRSEAHV
jgi:4-hydroxy-tetrahydrodipicolinate synthase